MAWDVEFSNEFGERWDSLTATEQKSVDFTVSLLQAVGPTLKMPHSSGIAMSRHTHMRDLRIQHEGRPYRVLYAFGPTSGGAADKTGNNRWYEEYAPLADAIYDRHLRELEDELKERRS